MRIIDLRGSSYPPWSKNNYSAVWSTRRHLLNQSHIVVARDIGEADWAPRKTSCGPMEAGEVMGCLKHIPIREDIEVLSQDCIMCVAEQMPRVRATVDFCQPSSVTYGTAQMILGPVLPRLVWEEVVRVPHHDFRQVVSHERLKYCLRNLRHASNDITAEVLC